MVAFLALATPASAHVRLLASDPQPGQELARPPQSIRLTFDSPLTAKVSTVWLNTPSPYGPLFILLMKSVVAVTGEHLVLAAAVTKVLMAVPLMLLCATLPGLE
ncbi:copper resistance protein CopC, partial [Kibdelosporangium lantanae]